MEKEIIITQAVSLYAQMVEVNVKGGYVYPEKKKSYLRSIAPNLIKEFDITDAQGLVIKFGENNFGRFELDLIDGYEWLERQGV